MLRLFPRRELQSKGNNNHFSAIFLDVGGGRLVIKKDGRIKKKDVNKNSFANRQREGDGKCKYMYIFFLNGCLSGLFTCKLFLCSFYFLCDCW